MEPITLSRWRVTTPPAARPVSLEDVRQHLNLLHHDLDRTLEGLVDAAVDQEQDELGRAFVTQSITLTLDEWPSDGYIELPRAPLQSVTEVRYFVPDVETARIVPPYTYLVDAKSEPGSLRLKSTEDWPSDELVEINAIEIEYVVGYGMVSGEPIAATISQASPAVVTKTAHGRSTGDAVVFATAGSLPAGLTAGTTYYVRRIDDNTFNVSATRDGARVITTSAGTGTHTVSLRDGRPSTMPMRLLQALLLLIGHNFANRSATTDQSSGNVSVNPMGYDRLISEHRLGLIV